MYKIAVFFNGGRLKRIVDQNIFLTQQIDTFLFSGFLRTTILQFY